MGAGDFLKLPDAVSFSVGATIEPLAVGLESVRRGGVQAGEAVLILGAGPIGLAMCQWARFYGASDVVVSDFNQHRLALANRMGASNCLNAAGFQGEPAALMDAFEKLAGSRADVIFEAVGRPGMIQQCVLMAGSRCRLVIAGACQEMDSFDPLMCTYKALDLIFPFGVTLADYRFIVEQLAQGKIVAEPLISHCISLNELPEMFEALRQPTDQCKVIIEY